MLTIRHLPFVERLASAEVGPTWYEVASGFLLLRCIDRVLQSPKDVDSHSLQFLEHYLAQVSNSELTEIFSSCLTALTETTYVQRRSQLQAPLLAYSRWLKQSGEDALSLDVMHTVLEMSEQQPNSITVE